MLKEKKISKIYEGKVAYRALTDIDLTVEDNEYEGIMGTSGSGETTLLNMIATIDEPTTGEIVDNEESTHDLKKEKQSQFRRRELGFVFKDVNLLHTLNVEENMVLPLTHDGKKVNEMKEKAKKMAKNLGITEIMNKRTYEISGGQAQRVAVARAMIHSPNLLLADEPTGNLDSKSSKDVMEMLESINQTEQTMMLLVTHDPQAASYCNRVVFIRDGKFHSEIHRGDDRQVFFKKLSTHSR